jgi:tripartite-type tricarboxylate transporter receptor subunit TctC
LTPGMLAGRRRPRLFTLALMTAFCLAGAHRLCQAADYPERAVTLVIPSPPGGGTDTAWRLIASKFGDLLGQPVVIENRPGASGNLGAAVVAKAVPDGYTLLALISSHVINPSLLVQVPYDLDRDFVPISRAVTVPGVLVSNASVPAQNLRELIAYARARPGKVTFSSAGVGSTSHLIMELFEISAGIKLLHVPYRGTAPALTDLIGDHVDLMAPDLTIAAAYIKEGRLRSYGVSSAERAPAAPDIPTLAEAGLPGFEALQWFGLAAPAGTPHPIVEKLYTALAKTLSDPDLKAHLVKEAMTPAPSTSPEEFAAFMRAEGAKWAKVIKDANITAQ